MEPLDVYLQEHGQRLGVYRGADFVRLPLPERKRIMGPWLVEQSLSMVYAERGLGKSLFLTSMCMAIAKGEPFLSYPACEPMPVVFVDGEMPPSELQKRLVYLGHHAVPSNLFPVSAPFAEEPWADLSDPYGQMQLREIVQKTKAKVLVLDNKSTLMPPNRENDAESWVDVQKWLIQLRQEGVAVVLVHHCGKNGLQRGTSLTEVTLDTSILLTKAESKAGGAAFVMQFKKNRHFFGDDAKPMHVELTDRNGAAYWEYGPVTAAQERDQQIRELAAQGVSQRQIAEQIGVGLATVNRTLKAS